MLPIVAMMASTAKKAICVSNCHACPAKAAVNSAHCPTSASVVSSAGPTPSPLRPATASTAKATAPIRIGTTAPPVTKAEIGATGAATSAALRARRYSSMDRGAERVSVIMKVSLRKRGKGSKQAEPQRHPKI